MPTAPRPVSALGQLRAVVDSGHGPIMMAAGDRQGQHKLSTRSGNDGKQPGTTGKAPGRRSRADPPRRASRTATPRPGRWPLTSANADGSATSGAGAPSLRAGSGWSLVDLGDRRLGGSF